MLGGATLGGAMLEGGAMLDVDDAVSDAAAVLDRDDDAAAVLSRETQPLESREIRGYLPSQRSLPLPLGC